MQFFKRHEVIQLCRSYLNQIRYLFSSTQPSQYSHFIYLCTFLLKESSVIKYDKNMIKWVQTLIKGEIQWFQFTVRINNNFNLQFMRKTSHPEHSKSHTGFVLIRGSSRGEQPTEWQWLTQRQAKPVEDQQQQGMRPRLSYSEKKRILSGLHYNSQSSSSFKIRNGFNLHEKKRVVSTASCASLPFQRKTQPFVYLNSNQQQPEIPALNFGIDIQQLTKSIASAHTKGNRILAAISVKRLGLRYKFHHAFVPYCGKCKVTHEHELRDLSHLIKQQIKEISRSEKDLYFFTTKGVLIHSYKDIAKQKLKVVLVDSSPRLQFTNELYLKVIELGDKIEIVLNRHIKLHEKLVPQKNDGQNSSDQEELDEENLYDHQRIGNVKQYVEQLSADPSYKLTDREQPNNELLSWYGQKFNHNETNQKQSDKNLLFETKNHYPQEIVNKKLLAKANQKVQKLPNTKNKHKYIPMRMDLMMNQVQRDIPPKKQKQSVYKVEAPVTKRDMLAHLDKKNSLLTTQNIPYLIQKYGLNRFQLFNLYNLYKSFEKIAVMRSPSLDTVQTVQNKGIDRQTFEVGLKGLDMNPGQELIKGICYFGDYISWQQFIKIISISLRKTPEQKLTAILKGISSFDTGSLSKHQISLMIGNSLQKLFDHEQPQLKDYFTEMAMTELDPEQTGKVSVQTMKYKVLGDTTGNMNMVAFLILNT